MYTFLFNLLPATPPTDPPTPAPAAGSGLDHVKDFAGGIHVDWGFFAIFAGVLTGFYVIVLTVMLIAGMIHIGVGGIQWSVAGKSANGKKASRQTLTHGSMAAVIPLFIGIILTIVFAVLAVIGNS